MSTFTPTVVRYLSEKVLRTLRATVLVLPTAKSPNRLIFRELEIMASLVRDKA